jgi:hypothetical protein
MRSQAYVPIRYVDIQKRARSPCCAGARDRYGCFADGCKATTLAVDAVFGASAFLGFRFRLPLLRLGYLASPPSANPKASSKYPPD